MVPLSSVVTPRRERGPTSIERVDGQRVTYVTAGLTEDLTLGEAVERLYRHGAAWLDGAASAFPPEGRP